MHFSSPLPTLWQAFFDIDCYRTVRLHWKLKTSLYYLFLIFVIQAGIFALVHWQTLFTKEILWNLLLHTSIGYIFVLFLCLFYACLIMLFGASFKLHITYHQAYRLAIVSMTPFLFFHIFVFQLVDHFDWSINNLFWLIEIALQIIYLFFAAFANKKI